MQCQYMQLLTHTLHYFSLPTGEINQYGTKYCLVLLTWYEIDEDMRI